MIESKIREFSTMGLDEFRSYSERCLDASAGSFNFDTQFDSFMDFLDGV